MRNLYSAVAAVLCLVAIGARAFDLSPLVSASALVFAGLFLVLALQLGRKDEPGKNRPLRRDDLSNENEAELRRLLDQGQFGTAVKQVQLWFRHVSAEEAKDFVMHYDVDHD